MAAENDAKKTELTAKTALCLAAITMVGIDGDFKDDELNKLRYLAQDDDTAFVNAFEIYNWRTVDECIDLVSQKLSEAQKRLVCKILYDYATVDREFHPTEQELLKQYGEKFGFSEKTMKEICEERVKTEDLSIFNA